MNTVKNVSVTRNVRYPRLYNLSWVLQCITLGSLSTILRMVFLLSAQSFAISITEGCSHSPNRKGLTVTWQKPDGTRQMALGDPLGRTRHLLERKSLNGWLVFFGFATE